MRYSHGISDGRMQQMLSEVSGLEISQGGIANLMSRVKDQLQSEVDRILAALRRARLVCSDETSDRVNGKNQWEWVFQNEHMCFHIIRASRGGDGIQAVMAIAIDVDCTETSKKFSLSPPPRKMEFDSKPVIGHCRKTYFCSWMTRLSRLRITPANKHSVGV